MKKSDNTRENRYKLKVQTRGKGDDNAKEWRELIKVKAGRGRP